MITMQGLLDEQTQRHQGRVEPISVAHRLLCGQRIQPITRYRAQQFVVDALR